MKIKKAKTLKNHLEKRFPGIFCFIDSDDPDHLFVSAEDGTEVDGMPLADCYDYAYFDPKEIHHEMGVHRKFRKFVKAKGWGIDWQNPGSLCLYLDD